jgi:hypothetical protein
MPHPSLVRTRSVKQVAEAHAGLVQRIDTPEPIVVIDTLQRNVSRMQEFADTRGLVLRPHVKTHKCIEIGRLQTDAGACGTTTSTPASTLDPPPEPRSHHHPRPTSRISHRRGGQRGDCGDQCVVVTARLASLVSRVKAAQTPTVDKQAVHEEMEREQ